MNSKDTIISIILPVWNTGHYLADCLDSLLASSIKNFEIIAIDDFSRDDSWKILKIYKKFDKRIRVYRNVKHYGKAITLNRALKKAKGEYIAFMDAKDLVYKYRLQRQYKLLSKDGKVVAVGSQANFINARGKTIQKSTFPTSFDEIVKNPLHGVALDFETIMINTKNLPKDLLYFNPNNELIYSEIIMKLLQYGKIENLPSYLQYRRTENPDRTTSLKKLPELIKLFFKSMDSYDYRPSLKTLFLSPLKQLNLNN